MFRAALLSRFSPFVLAGVALLGWTAPSHAYRMLQATALGPTQGAQPLVRCDDLGGFAHWNSRSITWYHNTGGQGSGKSSALTAALQTWTNVADSDYTLSYGGTTTAEASWDGINTFDWGTTSTSDLCASTPCHAITVLYMSGGQEITESDIAFNDTMDWRTDGTANSTCLTVFAGMALDTQAIATHELGHSLGIHHPEGSVTSEPSASATMGAQSCSVAGRSLSSDDIAALLCSEDRYPMAPSYEGYHEVASCSAISGWAWNANRPNRPSYVEIRDGSTLVDVVPADLYRSDLAAAGKGNGVHAFSIPSDFNDGERHTIYTRFSGTGANLQTTGKDVACGVSMFPGFFPDEVNSTGGTYTVATQFSSSRSGKVTALRYYRARGETGTSVIKLWNNSGGTPLATVTIGDSCNTSLTSVWPGRWCSGEISGGGVTIQANTLYRVGVDTRYYQVKSPCSASSPTSLYAPISQWPLTAQTAYWSAGDTFPLTNSCSNYFVDVSFDLQ
jgi:hypothetical protein